ncbi:hypothetical protein MGYG_07559 [Nannizzia gypsea CBS 118893]|uniref:Uncharacterized protein n=1 Tax=Arthroderma gypseum (strain ATCC MYA-4604 / CBS 118893) TaxID=535722 RepID=E4V3I0_ARTGP|nr:hypothetical protein MGYG_07559 [Nannizzia gypsea CBS 118893]EFR04554.1 hypothetical protein MGYG_07559 [Nannizzia gypsea CBS 118893]
MYVLGQVLIDRTWNTLYDSDSSHPSPLVRLAPVLPPHDPSSQSVAVEQHLGPTERMPYFQQQGFGCDSGASHP